MSKNILPMSLSYSFLINAPRSRRIGHLKVFNSYYNICIFLSCLEIKMKNFYITPAKPWFLWGTNNFLVENVYYCCIGEYSAYDYEFQEFESLLPDINGEVDISIIFNYIYPSYDYLKEEEVLSFFKNQDTENKDKLKFQQYFHALNHLEAFANIILLKQNNSSNSSNSSVCESTTSYEE